MNVDGHLERRQRGRRFDADASEERGDRPRAVLFEGCLESLEITRRPERDLVHVELARQRVAAAAVATDVEARVIGWCVRPSRADVGPRDENLGGWGCDHHRPKVKVSLDDPAAEVIGARSPRKHQTFDARVGPCVKLLGPASHVVARLADQVEEIARRGNDQRARRQRHARRRWRDVDPDPTEERGAADVAVLFEGRVKDEELSGRCERNLAHVELPSRHVASAAVAVDCERGSDAGRRVITRCPRVRAGHKRVARRRGHRYRPAMCALEHRRIELIAARFKPRDDACVRRNVQLLDATTDPVAGLAVQIEEHP